MLNDSACGGGNVIVKFRHDNGHGEIRRRRMNARPRSWSFPFSAPPPENVRTPMMFAAKTWLHQSSGCIKALAASKNWLHQRAGCIGKALAEMLLRPRTARMYPA